MNSYNHILVLLGVVDSAVDCQVAEVRAREVTGMFNVENGLSIVQSGKKEASK